LQGHIQYFWTLYEQATKELNGEHYISDIIFLGEARKDYEQFKASIEKLKNGSDEIVDV